MFHNVNILTGEILYCKSLSENILKGKFKHSLWVLQSDFSLFGSHPALKGIKLIKDAQPITVEKNFLDCSTLVFNIQQFTDKWALFEYFLYHRPTIGRICSDATFQLHLKLCVHSLKMGFTENSWVTKRFLENQLCGKFLVVGAPIGIFLYNKLESRATDHIAHHYNIEETNNPREVKSRLQKVACSIFSGRHFPPLVQESLFEASLKFGSNRTYWFQHDQRHLLEHHNVYLLKDATGIEVVNPRFGRQVYYNFEQTSDPLCLFKGCSKTWLGMVRFCDFVSRRKFRQNECSLLMMHQNAHGFKGYSYIKEKDLANYCAQVRHHHKDKCLQLSGFKWYNLDQIVNKEEVMRKELNTRIRLQNTSASEKRFNVFHQKKNWKTSMEDLISDG